MSSEVKDIVLDAVTTPAPNLLKSAKVLRHGKEIAADDRQLELIGQQIEEVIDLTMRLL